MNYLERYRSRVFRNTSNVRERERNDLILEFEKYENLVFLETDLQFLHTLW